MSTAPCAARAHRAATPSSCEQTALPSPTPRRPAAPAHSTPSTSPPTARATSRGSGAPADPMPSTCAMPCHKISPSPPERSRHRDIPTSGDSRATRGRGRHRRRGLFAHLRVRLTAVITALKSFFLRTEISGRELTAHRPVFMILREQPCVVATSTLECTRAPQPKAGNPPNSEMGPQHVSAPEQNKQRPLKLKQLLHAACLHAQCLRTVCLCLQRCLLEHPSCRRRFASSAPQQVLRASRFACPQDYPRDPPCVRESVAQTEHLIKHLLPALHSLLRNEPQ